jgi:hypothetical protein
MTDGEGTMRRKWLTRLLVSAAVGILAVTPLVIDFRLWLSEEERHIGPHPEHYTVPSWLATVDSFVEAPGILVQFLLSGSPSFASLGMRELAITNAVFYGFVTWTVLSWLSRRKRRLQGTQRPN